MSRTVRRDAILQRMLYHFMFVENYSATLSTGRLPESWWRADVNAQGSNQLENIEVSSVVLRL